jgi:hypothetical protein
MVGAVKGSRYHNMKELIPPGSLRVLFAFDRERHGVVLLGGDKANQWKRWYTKHVPAADRLYGQHLRDFGKERTWEAVRRRAGQRSAASER